MVRSRNSSTDAAEPSVRIVCSPLSHRTAAAWQVEVEIAQLRIDLIGRDPEGKNPVRLEHDADFAVDATDAGYLGDARNEQERPGYRVIDEPGDRLVTSVRRGHCVGQDRPARSLDVGHYRVTQTRRKIRADLRYSVAYLGDRAVDVLAEDELHNSRGGAVRHRGGNVPDVAETGDRILDAAGDQSLDLGWSGAGLCHGNHDRGQIEIGRVVDPQRREGNDSRQRQQQEQHADRNGIADRPRRDVVVLAVGQVETGVHRVPASRGSVSGDCERRDNPHAVAIG